MKRWRTILAALVVSAGLVMAPQPPEAAALVCIIENSNGCLDQWTIPVSVHECDVAIYHWHYEELKAGPGGGGEYLTGTFKWYISDGQGGWILYWTHTLDFGWVFRHDKLDVNHYFAYGPSSSGPGRVVLDLSSGINLAENHPTIIDVPGAVC